MLQRFAGKEGVVEGAQAVSGDDDDFAAESSDQILHGEDLAEGHEQASNALNEEVFAAPTHEPDALQDLCQTDSPTMLSGCYQRCQGFGEEEWCDLIEGELPILEGSQKFSVCEAAGSERLHRQRVATSLTQVVEKESGQEGLAYAGIGAGDENDATPTSSIHSAD
jgi:hypothetical protein